MESKVDISTANSTVRRAQLFAVLMSTLDSVLPCNANRRFSSGFLPAVGWVTVNKKLPIDANDTTLFSRQVEEGRKVLLQLVFTQPI